MKRKTTLYNYLINSYLHKQIPFLLNSKNEKISFLHAFFSDVLNEKLTQIPYKPLGIVHFSIFFF